MTNGFFHGCVRPVFGVLLCLVVSSAAAYNRVPTITKSIEIGARINVSLPVAPGLYIDVPQRYIPLTWNEGLKRFNDFSFQFDAWLNVTPGNLIASGVNVSIRDVQMNCQTRTGNYYYYGLRGDQTGSGASYYRASVLVAGGNIPEWDRINEIVLIPGSLLQNNAWQQDAGQELPWVRGRIQFEPPQMLRERADGGADCRGGALVMFSPLSV